MALGIGTAVGVGIFAKAGTRVGVGALTDGEGLTNSPESGDEADVDGLPGGRSERNTRTTATDNRITPLTLLSFGRNTLSFSL